jgi:hypothetical protein
VKRCTQEHEAPGFGTIPEGSLWDDDSPYVTADYFVDVDAEPEAPKKKAPARKFGQPKETPE